MHQPLWTVFGIGLYLAPSDMALHPGNVQGYNNEIMIAGSEAAIGHNPGLMNLNRSARPQAISPSKEKSQHQPGLITRGHRVANPQLTLWVMLIPLLIRRVKNNTSLIARPRQATKKKKRLAGVGVGLVVLWLWSR